MNHLGLILVREYLNKVRNKSFIIMTFMSPLLMVGVIGLVTYLSNLNNDNERHIKVLDQSGYFGHLFEDQDQITFELLDTIDLEQAKAITESAQDYGLLFIPKVKNIADLSRAIYFYSEDSPSIVVMTQIERIVQQQANTLALNQAGIDAQAIRDLYFDVRPQLETFKGQETSKLGSGLKLIFGGAAGYLLFMFIIIYGNMIMRSVIEEKTSRIIEVIISSVRPIELLLGKIFGTTLAGITQFAVWVILVGVLGTVMSQVLGVEMQTGSQVAMEQV